MPVPTLTRLQNLQVTDQRKEYLSGGYERTLSPLLNNAVQVLGQYQDELNREFTDRIYEEMLKDPAVAASVDILRALISITPPRVVSRIADKQHPEYDAAREVADFVASQLSSMNRPMATIVAELMEAVVYGSCVAEIVYLDDVDEKGAPILKLADIKAKARRKYAFVCDRFFNILGVVSRELGYMASGIYTGSTNPDPKDVIPREKILVLTFNSRYGDPRGMSVLRPAYAPYYIKTQIWPQFLKFLIGFASPSLVGYTPENGPEEIDAYEDDGVTPKLNADGSQAAITPEEDMLATLLGFQAGTVAVLKGGSKLDVLWSQGAGEGFQKAIDLFDRQIAMAILKTHRTLLEAKHGSKADAESAQDITDVYVALLRDQVGGVLTHDLAYQLVFVNKGLETAKKYAPTLSLQAVNKQDFAKAAEAVAKLWAAKYLHPSQVEEVDALIGLPERDMDSFLADIEQANEDLRLDQMERMKLMNPGAGQDGEDDEEAAPKKTAKVDE